jgi:acetyltransferase-like isoleucine patch superfamily enzyme
VSDDRYREQHKLRLCFMPWLYDTLKPEQRLWAEVWQQEIQASLATLETVLIGADVFIAPTARIFAEPGRTIRIGDGVRIAADCVLHGPITLHHHVSVNHHVTMDGGRAGIEIGANTRIAAYATLFAFNHGMASDRKIREQPVTSKGILIGEDVWIGAKAGVVDGIRIGDGAVIGMNAQVTRDVAAGTIVGGNPAVVIGMRS